MAVLYIYIFFILHFTFPLHLCLASGIIHSDFPTNMSLFMHRMRATCPHIHAIIIVLHWKCNDGRSVFHK